MKRAQFLTLAGVSLGIVFSAISPAHAQQQPLPAQPASSASQNSSAAQAPASAQQRADLVRKRAEWFQKQRAYPFTHVPPGALQQAIEQRNAMIQQKRSGLGLAAPPLINFPGNGLWQLTGPQPTNVPSFPGLENVGFPTVSGRVTALAVDTTDTTGNTIYLGAAAGGVWKTTNGGTSWTPLTDNQPSLAVGSIAIDPNNHNTIYVGTGEDNFNLDGFYGVGVLKSTDGGATWTQLGASVFSGAKSPNLGGAKIGAIAVQPGNSNVVLASVDFFDGNDPSGGVYQSLDGGVTWNRPAAGAQGAAGTDLVFDPTSVAANNAATVYAALGDIFSPSAASNGIWKSTDSGAHWTKLAGGLPATNVGRITLAYARNTSGATATIYAAIADASTSSGLLLGFFVTTNGGTSWTKLTNTPDFCVEPGGLNGQCFYDLTVAVHPANANFVVVGGGAYLDNSTTLFKSTDGGVTWSTDTTTPATDFTVGSTNVRPHVDTHVLAFAPNGATPRLYTGDDGGVWRTDDPTPGNPLWVDLNATLAISQFYPGATPSVSDENYGFGGTQDNDIQVFSGALGWTLAPACGDGGYTAVDTTTPTTIYAGCDALAGAKVTKSVFNGLFTPGPIPTPAPSFVPAETEITASGDTMGFIPPLVIDPQSSSTLYFGTCRIWQTTSGGVSQFGLPAWSPITGDLTNGNASVAACADADEITTIDVSQQTFGLLLVGTSNGKVWQSSGFPIEIDNGLLPNRHITAVRSKPSDATGNIAYVTFSGFGSCAGCGNTPGHVFKTTNATQGPLATWTNISGNLPDVPVNDIIVDHHSSPTSDALYIATDVGVFSCPDPESATPCTNWTVVGDGLPNSPVLSLAMRPTSRILRAATHGRSMWDIQLTDVQPTPQLAVPTLGSLTPAAVMAGSPTTTVTVTGVNFGPNTQVAIGTGPFAFIPTGLTTTFVSTTQLTVSVPATLLTDGTVVDIGLTDPLGTSAITLPFTVMNPIPDITGVTSNISPGIVAEPVTFTLTGTGFVNGTELTINGFDSFGIASNNGKTLTVTVDGSALTGPVASPGATVTVFNPTPGGGPAAESFKFVINANGTAEITFDPNFVFFPALNAGGTSAVMNVQLMNCTISTSPGVCGTNGGATLALSAGSATKSGTNAGDFSVVAPSSGSPICAFAPTGTATSIAPGASCFFGVVFTPIGTLQGTRFATLTVSDNDSDGEPSLFLEGEVNGPIASVFPNPIAFGSVPKGIVPLPLINVTVSNFGSGAPALAVASVGILPSANSADFAIAAPTNGGSACTPSAGPFMLASVTSCSFGITFNPSLINVQETATLEFTFSNGTVAKIDIPMSGTGVVPTIASISPEIVATGGPTFALTVNGRNYVLGSVVNLNGNARLTTFVNATQLLASIPATDLTVAGSSAITVTNPAGGGTSEPKSLFVAQAPTGTNDNFANATDTSSTPFRITQDTTQFTTNTGGLADPSPACAPGGATLSGKARSAWFKFVAPASGRVVADTRFSSYNTILSVWTGAPGSFTAVTCNNGGIPGATPESFVGFNVTNGTTYFLMVTDASASGAGGTLTFRLDFASAAPANDDWANATVVPPASTPFSNSVNTILATINTGGHADPTPLCAPAGAANGGIANSVWYSLTPTSTTPVTADTLTSLDDTILSVWTGTPGAFTQVACNDNAGTGPTQVLQSQVSFTATGGTTYYFMISSVLGDGGTAFHLRLTAATSATLSSIAVTPANPSVAAGKTQQFTATGTFSDNSTQDLTNSVTWASGTPANATISAAGLATAVKVGTSTISATSGAVVGSTTLTVTAATLSSIAVTPANPSVAAGKTQQFTATGTFSDNSTQNLTGSVTWASGTPANATINAAGLATAVKVGTSTISATSGAVVGSTTLTVTAATLSSIAVTPANPSVAAGKTQQFTATGTFSDNSTQDLTSSVTWASGTPANATINAAGLATAVKVGTSTISATSGAVVGSTTLTVTAAMLSSIAVTPANPSVAAGKTQQFTATGTFSDNSTQNLTSSVTWSSGTPANATINAAGLATAVKVGTSTISATSGAVVGSTTLTVTAATLSSIAVTPANPSVAAGKTQQFTATGTFSDNSTQNLTGSVTWSSGTPANATINAAGLATAVKVGTSTISATSGAVVGSTTLTVTAATLSSIAVTPATPTILVAATQQFTATGTFSDNSTQNLTGSVTWASGTPTVATINAAGLATAVKAGTSTISATSGGVVGSTTLTVANATLVSIAVTPANPSVAAGKTQQFTATGTFSDNSTQNLTGSVTWSSGTPANATINAAGLATAVKVGTSTISATSGSVVGSTTLTVTAATLSSIAVTPANPSVAAGKTQQFTATGTFSDSSTQDLTSSVTWASGTPANATINAAGLATAVKVGTSTISATSGAVVGSTTLTVTAATLSSIAVTPANPSIPAGKTQQFTATGTFSDNSTQNLTSSVTWSSSDTTIATINAAGLATGVKVGGPVTIKATSGAVIGTTSFTLTAAVLTSIAVTPANPSVAAGKTQQFTATGTFSDNSTQNLTSSVTWSSGTTTVATIDAAGLATTLKVGTSTISATSGSVVGSTTLTVTAATLSSIAVTPATPTIIVAGTQQFTATGTFSDSSTQDLTGSVTWASGTTTVATINAAGLATGVKAGSTTISATSGSVVGSTTLTVTNATLVSIAVTPVNPSVAAGKTQQFTATGTFSDNSTQNITSTVTWSSSDTTIATINAAGLATGVKLGGPVTIKAASGSVNGTTTFTVTAAVLSSIAVTPANPSVAAGKTQQFTATGTFSDNSTQDLTSSVTWASGTTTVATINAAGLATTLKIGTSTISATSGSIVGSTTLTVTAATLSSIAVTPANPSVPAGKTQQFTATGTFSDNSTKDLTTTATWASGTTTIATINAAGLATALKIGTSTISATSGNVVGSTTLTVTAATLSSIAVTPSNPSVPVGNTQQFTATGTFSDNSTQDLTSTATWASGTTTVATINAAGLASAVKAGTSTISATSGSIVGSTTLTVTAPPAVTTNPVNQTVNAGSSVTFTAAASGSPAPTVQWQVSVGGGAFSNVPSATSTTLTFTTTFSQNGNKYQAVFTNSVGTATTTAATLTVTAPDVTISKSHTGDFTVGSNGVYTIKVTNTGTGPTTGNVTVTDNLPAVLTFVSGSGANWTCAAAGQAVTCTYSGPALAAAGGNSTVTLTVSVAPGAFPSVTNTATVADPNDSKSTDKSSTDTRTDIDNVVPTQSSFSPALGLVAGATSAQQITITGSGFNSSTQVTLGSNPPLNGTANAAGTTLTISVPAADLAMANAGNLTITVTNPKNPNTNLGGGTVSNLTFPLVAFAAAQDASTPGTIAVNAGTPATVKIDYTTNPANSPLPAALTVTCAVPQSLTSATCAVNGGTIAAGAPSGSATITINAIPTKSGNSGSTPAPWTGGRGPWSTYLLWLVAAVLLSILGMWGTVRQRTQPLHRAPAYLTLALLVLAAGALVGCTTTAQTTPTPTGPSSITVTATAADGASVTTTVNIVVSN